MMHDTCVFVSTSDNTFDVFEKVSPSLLAHWPAGLTKLYAGMNERTAPAPFETVRAPISGWRNELLHQIESLPDEHRYVILVLDDFFFKKDVDPRALARLLEAVKRHDIDYLRMKPLLRSFLGSILLKLWARPIEPGIIRLGADEPYYASLQVAAWKRTYLCDALRRKGSIWEFEHVVPDGSKHYAVGDLVLDYEHLVEKGKWFRHAPGLLGLPETEFARRGFLQPALKYSRWYNRIKFAILGYMVFNYKRRAVKTRLLKN
jgi:hypothetical protein